MPTATRRATGGDAAAIMRIRDASWRAAYGPLLPEHVWDDTDPAPAAARLAARIDSGEVTALVAEVAGEVRAYSLVGPCRDEDLPSAAEIYAIYADPAHWSTGLGRALLPASIAVLEARPIVLWVLAANTRARRFYELAGLHPDGARQDAQMPGGVLLPEVRYRLE